MPARLRGSVAVLGGLAVFASGAVRASVLQGYVVRVSVAKAPATHRLADDFLGLAVEYRTIPKWVGTGSPSVNPVLVQLIHNLDPVGRPVLRIGGESTDRTWWPAPGLRRPLGVTYNLTSAWAASARALAQATGARLLLGLNLEADRPMIDKVEGARLLRGIGRSYIDALEIGNEPPLYSQVPWYKRLNGRSLPWYSHEGRAVYARGPGYGPAEFVAEFSRALKAAPLLPVAGPESSSGPWLEAFRRLLSPRSRVRMLTSHAYGLNECVTKPSTPLYPSVPHLLSPSASRGLVDSVMPYVALAHREGARYRIDELGSISCNGRAGVSNTMASALWVLDALFSIAQENVDGVNLHTYPNSVNGLFDFEHSYGGWTGTVHPMYYGALMFAQAAPAGSRLLRIDTSRQDRLRVWATLGPDHRVRVLVINDSLRRSALTLVHAPRGFGSAAATIERLLASSPYAKTGITLGGASMGASTRTGIQPPPLLQKVPPRAGTYKVTLPASSAALLTLSR
jgi:hypothetical protein